jgi:hypothetical protein
MGKALYYVISEDGRWKIRHSGADYPYFTQPTAISAAIDAAHTSGARGYEAEVLIEDEDGQWNTLWVHGRDPYPPTR